VTRPLTVLKFGSSVLPDEAALPLAGGEVRRHLARGHAVLAVVSALGGSTDGLIARAHRVAADPDPAALAALLATGESTAAALLGVALGAAGMPATVLDPGRVGPLTHGPLLDARPYELNRAAIRRALEHRLVAVLPGFVGRTDDGRTSLLGRGGSDLSALFSAWALQARCCVLLKDVDGVYERDPISSSSHGPRHGDERHRRSCRRYLTLSFEDATRLGGAVIQPEAAQFAERHALDFRVARPGSDPGTLVGRVPTSLMRDRSSTNRESHGGERPDTGPGGAVWR